MVPASTLMYGSIFWSVTRKPRASRSEPMEAEASPFPSDDTTPPVTKMYFVGTSSLLPGLEPVSNILDFRLTVAATAVEPEIAQAIEHLGHRGAAPHPQPDDLLAAQHGAHAPRRVHPPFEGGPRRRIAAEPEGGQLQIRAIAEQPAPAGPRGSLDQSVPEPARDLERARRTGQRLAAEAEPAERRRSHVGRLLGEQRHQGQLETRDVEAVLPRPRERPGQRAQALAGGAREAIARIEEAKDAGRPEPAQRQLGARLGEDPVELGGDPLAGERGIGAQTQREGLAGGRPAVVDEVEPRGIARP